jgi:hypothetical protein
LTFDLVNMEVVKHVDVEPSLPMVV